MIKMLLKSAMLLAILNEIRGFVLAAPVLYGLWKNGGTTMQIILAISTLAGIALSVIVPIVVARMIKHKITA
jgi:hypothetical protein